MVWTDIITKNTGWIALFLILSFSIWFLIIKPRMNEGKSLDYEANKKPVGEVIQEVVENATSTDVDF